MTETLFTFDERNYRDCQQSYRGDVNQEYYLGDYTIESASNIEVRADRKGVGSSSIINLHSRTRLRFDRSWSHIQQDATDVIVLWFVKHGSMEIRTPEGLGVAEAGDFAITKSMQPFSICCETDDEFVHDVLHVIVPTYEFRRFVPHEVKAGLVLKKDCGRVSLAEQLLRGIFQENEGLSERTEQLMVESTLALVADAIDDHSECLSVRPSLRETRLQNVLRYIDLHLSDPKLSTAAVAEACGISQRYLSELLKLNGTPFSDHVWNKRVEAASRWLASTEAGEISIAEIAFRVGFKSPAHFSRMFKRVHAVGPREYRQSRRLEEQVQQGDALDEFSLELNEHRTLQ
jgi:AraC-like DNA-binding protein